MNFTADEFARGKRILLHCFVVSLSTGCPQDDTRGDDEVETGTTGDIDGSGDESDDSDGFCESGPDNCTFAPIFVWTRSQLLLEGWCRRSLHH